MKKVKRITLKVGAHNYYLSCRPNGSNSNYDRAIHIFRVGEKMPIIGSSMKNTESLEDYRSKALNKIKSLGENEIEPFII